MITTYIYIKIMKYNTRLIIYIYNIIPIYNINFLN